MSRRLVFATGNTGKIREVQEILKDFNFEILSIKDLGIDIDIVENGSTFEENAALKVNALKKFCDDIIIADDSGLEVDALNKEPGIYSARYLGEDTSYEVKMNDILRRMENVPFENRTARFVAAVAAYVPEYGDFSVRGTFEGYIAYEPKGEYGFGYDPIFYLPEYSATSAEILPEEKNRISHRAKAVMKLAEKLKETGL